MKKALVVLGLSVSVVFALFVWPTRWRYDQVFQGRLPIRTDRFTGKVQRFDINRGWTWIESNSSTGVDSMNESVDVLARSLQETNGKKEEKEPPSILRDIAAAQAAQERTDTPFQLLQTVKDAGTLLASVTFHGKNLIMIDNLGDTRWIDCKVSAALSRDGFGDLVCNLKKDYLQLDAKGSIIVNVSDFSDRWNKALEPEDFLTGRARSITIKCQQGIWTGSIRTQ